ncbi:MAG: hypothetical protein NTW97_03275, partial [Candidatus Krumholzibacteria bacterium]|nr:hypothetical protein [Candidatus Krumholzibacteria bacterium]
MQSKLKIRASSIPIIVGIVLLNAMNACAPAPKYRAHPETTPPATRGTVPRDRGEVADLGIRLSPPVKRFSPARITSPFGSPPSNDRRHDGIDIKAAPGEEILA